MFPFVLLGALGFALWWAKNRGGTSAAPMVPAAVSTAAQLNVVMLGGTPGQKQAAVMAYEKAKGLPVTGLYTVAIQHAMQDDGVANPAPLPASVTEE